MAASNPWKKPLNQGKLMESRAGILDLSQLSRVRISLQFPCAPGAGVSALPLAFPLGIAPSALPHAQTRVTPSCSWHGHSPEFQGQGMGGVLESPLEQVFAAEL